MTIESGLESWKIAFNALIEENQQYKKAWRAICKLNRLPAYYERRAIRAEARATAAERERDEASAELERVKAERDTLQAQLDAANAAFDNIYLGPVNQ